MKRENHVISNIFSEILGVFRDLIGNLAEIFALIHWLSDATFIISLIQLISGNGIIGGYLLWIVSSLISSILCGALAELLTSNIPTPLRWAKPFVEQIIQIVGL